LKLNDGSIAATTSIDVIKVTKMILINSRFEYYHTLYNCIVGRDYVHNGKEQCRPFIPGGKSIPYFKINGKLVSIYQLLNQRFLTRMNPVSRDLPDWCY